MKPFKVICIKNDNMTSPCPLVGKIYEVEGLSINLWFTGWYYLTGFIHNGKIAFNERVSYNPICFKKVDDNFADETIENIKEQIKEEQLILTT